MVEDCALVKEKISLYPGYSPSTVLLYRVRSQMASIGLRKVWWPACPRSATFGRRCQAQSSPRRQREGSQLSLPGRIPAPRCVPCAVPSSEHDKELVRFSAGYSS